MRSHGKGSMSATTQVKVLSPENNIIALGQGLHFLETKIRTHAKGESVTDVPGSKAVAGRQIVNIGTWENRIVPKGSVQEAGEVTRKYGDLVVGLIHSRGVVRVMPDEFQRKGTLEGVSSLTQSDEESHAIH